MSHNRIPPWALAVLAVIVLLGLGSAVQSAAWSEGYTMGLLAGSAGGADGASLVPYLVSRTGSGLPIGGVGNFFGVFVRIGFILLLIAMAAKFFGFKRWGMHGAQGPWRHHHCWPGAEPNDAPPDETTQPVKNKPNEPTVMQV